MSAGNTPAVPLADVRSPGNTPLLHVHWMTVALGQGLLGNVVPRPQARDIPPPPTHSPTHTGRPGRKAKPLGEDPTCCGGGCVVSSFLGGRRIQRGRKGLREFVSNTFNHLSVSTGSQVTSPVAQWFKNAGAGEGNVNPLQCSCLENPRDGGAWWAAVYGVAESDSTEAT